MKIINIICVLILIAIGTLNLQVYQLNNDEIPFSSTVVGNDYQYKTTTSTPSTSLFLKSSRGSLGSFIVTKAGIAGGVTTLTDASTTNGVLNKVIATFPTDLVAGTYTFDVEFDYGLYMTTTTSVGSSTITYRQ